LQANKKNSAILAIVLVLAICFLYSFNIGKYDLLSPDEPRYSEVAREAAAEGNWIIPSLNNKVYYEKPPLYFDIIALSGKLAGDFTVTSVRIPGIIIASLLVGIVAYFTSRKVNFLTGMLSGIILAGTGLFFWMSMKVNLDIPLIFCTTAATFLLFDDINSEYSNKAKVLLAFLLMGLATIIKSPIAFLPVLIIVVYALSCGKKDSLKRIPWFLSFAAGILPAAIWICLAYLQMGYPYIKVTVVDQILEYSTGEQGHANPFYYYLTNLPAVALPWSLFFIPAVYYVYKRRKELPELVKFSSIWFVTAFIIFSAVGSKRGIYLLQLYPAFALITAWFFYNHFKKTIKEKYSLVIPVLLLAISFAGLFVVGLFAGKGLIEKELEINLSSTPGILNLLNNSLIFSLIMTILLIFAAVKRKKPFIFGAVTVLSVSIIVFSKTFFLPAINPYKSERFLAEALAEQYNKNTQVGLWGSVGRDCGFIFYNKIYFDTEFNDGNSAINFLSKEGRQILVVNKEKKLYENVPKDIYENFDISKFRVGSHNMLLLVEKR